MTCPGCLEREAVIKRQREALELAWPWIRQDEDTLEQFERIAKWFHKETGYLRPGKDSRLHSREERAKAWDTWIQAKSDDISRAAEKALALTPKSQPLESQKPKGEK